MTQEEFNQIEQAQKAHLLYYGKTLIVEEKEINLSDFVKYYGIWYHYDVLQSLESIKSGWMHHYYTKVRNVYIQDGMYTIEYMKGGIKKFRLGYGNTNSDLWQKVLKEFTNISPQNPII